MATSAAKRIAYLESLALKQAALLRTLQSACTLPADTARKVKEALDEAARIPQAQAVRQQLKEARK